ncbi:MAG: SDR family oxidoreductase [Deltaproteobacteria bacterium]|nr:SDR family oxidoreductase [Deltaproteobacteria bacterium]
MRNKALRSFLLRGKNVIITGASSGIGRQCAITCSEMGANVILFARNEIRLQETITKLKTGTHLYYALDITQYDQIESFITQTVQKVGKISGFIHSAGIETTIPLHVMKSKNYENIFAINVVGGFEFAKILSKKTYLCEQGASFIFISSIMGTLGQLGKIGYCSSKGALIAGSKAMALELARKSIRVNCISPAIVETEMIAKLFENIPVEAKQSIVEMHPLGFGKPEDIANACVFLLSEASRWITGTNLIIDGGYSAK